MKDEDKTKEQLINELMELRQRITELEVSETERKRAEEALAETTQLLETILDHTHMLVAYLDPQFNFVRVNRAYAEADEREPSFFPGKNHFDLYPNAENEEIFRHVVDTGEPYFVYAKPFEYAEHPERGVTYWDWSLVPIKDPGGAVTGLVFTLTNVTERVRAEEALRESEEKYRDLVENINDVIYAVSEDGVLTYVSPAIESFIGYSPSEVIGRHFREFIHQEDLTRLREGFQSVLSGHIEANEYRVLTKSGEIRWMRTSSRPVFRGDRVIGAQGVLADITERKQVEEALLWEAGVNAVMAELSTALISSASIDDISLLVLDRAKRLTGSAFGFVGYIDPQTGYLVSTTMTRDIWDTCQIPDKDIVFKKFTGLWGWVLKNRRPLLTNTPSNDPRSTGIPQGHIPIHRFLAAPALIGEELVGQVALANPDGDYTERDLELVERLASLYALAIQRKRAEEQLQRYAAELEQSNEELKTFAYTVSHDLRAPLVNIKGFSDELDYALQELDSTLNVCLPHIDEKKQLRIAALLQEDVPEALGFIGSSINRMDHLINAILQLSRLGRRELTPELINMEALVQSTLESLAHQIEQHGVRVMVGALPEIVADRTSMEQIVGNILDNAVKYLEPGRPGEIEITAERSPGETTFHIRDNGRGIAKEDIPKVFDLFRRAGKQDVPGEGMGLAYARTLIRRHGGRIWCESKPGVSTTFGFTIPRR